MSLLSQLEAQENEMLTEKLWLELWYCLIKGIAIKCCDLLLVHNSVLVNQIGARKLPVNLLWNQFQKLC